MSIMPALSGPSSSRPYVPSMVSKFYFDTTLGKPLYWNATHWYDTTGTIVADYVPPGAILLSDATGLSGSFAPGSIILIARGSVTQGPITFSSSGTAAAPIIIGAYGVGTAPIINGNQTIYTDALTITGAYVDISGLLCQNTNRSGIQIGESNANAYTHDVWVHDCEMQSVGLGVGMDGYNFSVKYCYIHDLTMVKNTPTPTNDDYGANGVSMNGSNIEVAYNRILRAKAASYDYGSDGGAFELFAIGPISNISIHDNYVEACDGFLEAGAAYGTNGGITNLSVYRNISLNNGGFGVIHNGGGSFFANWANPLFYNNTIVEESAVYGTQIFVLDNPAITGFNNSSFSNNIVSLSGGDSIFKQAVAGYRKNNCFLLLNRDSSGKPHVCNNYSMTLYPGEVIADPLFINQAGRNFGLTTGSPAAGMGAF